MLDKKFQRNSPPHAAGTGGIGVSRGRGGATGGTEAAALDSGPAPSRSETSPACGKPGPHANPNASRVDRPADPQQTLAGPGAEGPVLAPGAARARPRAEGRGREDGPAPFRAGRGAGAGSDWSRGSVRRGLRVARGGAGRYQGRGFRSGARVRLGCVGPQGGCTGRGGGDLIPGSAFLSPPPPLLSSLPLPRTRPFPFTSLRTPTPLIHAPCSLLSPHPPLSFVAGSCGIRGAGE